MQNNHWTLCTLVLTLACAPEGSPIDGLSLPADGDDTDSHSLLSSTAHGEVSPLSGADRTLQRSDQRVAIDNPLPPTASGKPAEGEGVLRCASNARNWESFGPESFLFEAERSEDGLEVDMIRRHIHNTDAEPSLDASQTITEFTWNTEQVSLWIEADHPIGVTAAAVEGTGGHLFVGGGYYFCFGIEVVCWDEQLEPRFTYDLDTGQCTDSSGREGLNPWPIEMVRETGDAECADLRGVALEEGDYSYPTLRGWNLRGAVLDDASFHFANLWDADLRGADLSGLDMGYAAIDGQFDGFTQLPDARCERFFDGTAFCIQ